MTAEPAIPAEEAPASLQDRLSVAAPSSRHQSAAVITDPVGLFRHLESSGQFHRDSRFGRIFHRGRVSLRENQPTDSLHVVIDQNHVAAHVDRVSPLGLRPEQRSRYSARRAAAHNVVGAAQDLVRLLRGRQGDHRSELDCEWVWDHSESEPQPHDLLDPAASAWSVQLEVRVSGTLDPVRLTAAIGAGLGDESAGRRVLEVVDCPDDISLDRVRVELQSLPVAPNTWPPVRVRLARHAGGDVLMLNLNHAACDGVAALHVLRRIASAYSGARETLERPDFLAVRELPVRPASAPVSVLLARYRSLVEGLRDLLARPALLAPDRGAAGGSQETDGEPGHGFHLVRVSAEETARILDVERPGTSRNVLLAALHLAIGDWNLQHGGPGRRIGVLVPVNLRPEEWQDDVVGNFSVTARVSTSRRHRAGPASALEAITAQTTRNKRSRSGTALLAALERSGLLPLWGKQSLVVLQPLTGNRLVDTAMLANQGPLEPAASFGPDVGEVLEVWFSVPARAPRSLCIGAVTVSGQLHLTFRYPRRLFSPEAARRFADCYLRQVRAVAEHRLTSGQRRTG